MPNEFDVVIVGAGAAGIAAARQLHQTGYSVAILEASPRLGGRAWTEETGGHALDLGCGWLHSAERNPWTRIAEDQGVAIDRADAAWGTQHLNLGFSPDEQRRARAAWGEWEKLLPDIAANSDRASDALSANNVWNPYIRAICGFANGVAPDQMSAKDYLSYDAACSYRNWRVSIGLGKLISHSLPPEVALSLSTPVEAIVEDGRGVRLRTAFGDLRAQTAILTVSTNVLVSDAITFPSDLDPWRSAASDLPLGHDEKLFLQSRDPSFVSETHVLGDPSSALACDFYIRPFGWPVIECYLGGDSAHVISEHGHLAGFALAIDQLATLFGSDIRSTLKPLVASNWARTDRIGGAYSCALPGRSDARRQLARPWKEKLFFAGEATSVDDFATAHGAYNSGIRTADEVMAVLAKPRGVAA